VISPRVTRHRLEDACVGALFAVARRIPRRGNLAIGRALGRVVATFDRRHVGIAAGNLRQAFPEWAEARVQRTARGVYAHLGQVLFELMWMSGQTRETIQPLIEIEGGEHVEAAIAAGRGILFATAHIGGWEMCGVTHGWNFVPMGAVYRPLDNPLLDRRLANVRRMSGNTLIDKRRALGRLLRRLRKGDGVAMLIDQNVQEKDGIFAQFFGRPASTTTSAALLALKTGCTLLGGWMLIGPDDRYTMRYDAPIVVESTGDRERDVARITQALNDMIERWVRSAPEQWLWIHRRWHTQPPQATTEGDD